MPIVAIHLCSSPKGLSRCALLCYKHSVSVCSKSVILFERYVVCIHNQVVSAECTYNHEHCRQRHLEVCNQRIGYTEFVRREYKFVCPTFKFFQILCPPSFERFTMSQASFVTNICSLSVLCLVRSSTSISLKFPRPAWRVI